MTEFAALREQPWRKQHLSFASLLFSAPHNISVLFNCKSFSLAFISIWIASLLLYTRIYGWICTLAKLWQRWISRLDHCICRNWFSQLSFVLQYLSSLPFITHVPHPSAYLTNRNQAAQNPSLPEGFWHLLFFRMLYLPGTLTILWTYSILYPSLCETKLLSVFLLFVLSDHHWSSNFSIPLLGNGFEQGAGLKPKL